MRKKIRLTAVLMFIAMCTACFLPMTSFAGISYEVINNTSFEEKISSAIWNNPESDVLSDNGKLVFPEESTEYTRLISKTAVKQSKELEKMFDAEYTLKPIKIPKGKEFILACGLSAIESVAGEEGTVELVLTNNGGITASLRVYETDGEPTELAKATKIGASVGSNLNVSIQLTTSQKYTAKINGKQIYSGKLPISGAGRIGFLQTGECHVEISSMNIMTYSYDTPENSNIEEHFDDDGFNASLLYAKMLFSYSKYYPSSLDVQEYNGNEVLMFQNAGQGLISTTQQYSNFEMTFDVPYLQRVAESDEDGNTIVPRSGWIGITFGDEAMSQGTDRYVDAIDMIYFASGSQVRSLKKESTPILADLANSKYAFWGEKETRGFSIKFSLVDAHIEVGIKWMDEKNFTTVASYDLEHGITPTGYIHIWLCQPSNLAIDNLVVTNLDKNAALIETEYKSSKVIVPDDYAYQAESMTYNPELKEDEGFNWYLIIPCAAVVAVLCVAVPAIVVKTQKGKEKRKNEE